MKIAIVLPSELQLAPYIHNYISIIKDENVLINYITWSRFSGTSGLKSNEYTYPKKSSSHTLLKIYDFYKFSQFAKEQLSKQKYDLIIVFSIQLGVFLSSYLKNNYLNRYILDIRDHSLICKFTPRKYLHQLLDGACFNTISSPGFQNWLPKGHAFVVSHNYSQDNKQESLPILEVKKQYSILTIGQIRDYKPNLHIIQQLSNNNKFKVNFVGKGVTSDYDSLVNYVQARNISNVKFYGKYKKEDEYKFILEADFISIYLEDNIARNNALSNRFYLGLLFHKPLIVNNTSIHASYVKKYNLGICISESDSLEDEILKFMSKVDKEQFINNCNFLLEQFNLEQDIFKSTVINTINKHVTIQK